MTKRSPNVAVVLSGCGYLDGAEIQESVSVLTHLGRVGAKWHCFAPDLEQAHSVNHYTEEVEPRRQRIVMHEAARIVRGKKHVSPLGELEAAKFDALIIPGGFGVARNLCTFAVDGADCEVLPEMARALKLFHATGKPVGMCCIAPVLAAKILGKSSGGNGCRITLGGPNDAAAAAKEMGAEVVTKGVLEVVVDEENHLVSTPAYMCDTTPWEVFQGVGKMVDMVMEMVGKAPARV